jgi:adhesin/invasin
MDATTTFVADASTAKVTAVTVDKPTATVGGDVVRVTATVLDGHDNPVLGASVAFTSNNGAALAASPVFTDDQGRASTTLTHTLAGASVITATGPTNAMDATTTFVADASTAVMTSTIGTDHSAANGSARNTMTFSLRDGQDNPIPSTALTVVVDTGGALVVSTDHTTAANGTVTVEVTSLIAATARVTATAATANKATSTVDTTFVADASTAQIIESHLTFHSPNEEVVANNIDKYMVTATVTDANGNRLRGRLVSFTADNNAQIMPSSVTTDVYGQAHVELKSTKAGRSTVTAFVGKNNVRKSAVFVADRKTAKITARVSTDGSLANNKAKNTVTAMVTDAKNNPISDVAVTFSGGAEIVISKPGHTGADGMVTVDVTSRRAVAHTVSVAMSGQPKTTVSTFFIADKDNVVGIWTRESENHHTFVIKDVYDNPIIGEKVTLRLFGGATWGAGFGPTSIKTTDKDGKVNAYLFTVYNIGTLEATFYPGTGIGEYAKKFQTNYYPNGRAP